MIQVLYQRKNLEKKMKKIISQQMINIAIKILINIQKPNNILRKAIKF